MFCLDFGHSNSAVYDVYKSFERSLFPGTAILNQTAETRTLFDLMRRLLSKWLIPETTLLSVIFHGVDLDDRAGFLIEGVVDNEGDKNIANIRANGVPGVFSVKNNLQVVNN